MADLIEMTRMYLRPTWIGEPLGPNFPPFCAGLPSLCPIDPLTMHRREMEPYEVLQRISDEVFADLECQGLHHSCIEGSALLTSVLRMMGFVDTYPLTVGVTIFNKAHQDWVKANGVPADEASCRACDAAGSMTIVIGKGTEHIVSEDRWAGHLVVIVPAIFGDRHALLDLTIVQAHQPEWGIVLQPLCLRVRDQFVSGKIPVTFLSTPAISAIQHTLMTIAITKRAI